MEASCDKAGGGDLWRVLVGPYSIHSKVGVWWEPYPGQIIILTCSFKWVAASPTVDCEKLEHGRRRICDGVPSCLGFGVGGRSYSNFLAFTLS